ncbi:MAG TPA: sugar isomerase domain-containing protein, partial [Verrucomicrobiota bacterium]|nr:sugar isomerase domain-containing protein [Verrucomicrobiota bacterium]
MTLAEKYLQTVKGQIEALGNSQVASVETAAGWFAEAISAGRLVYIFGTGHSHMLAEELFYRAGGLASIVPMLQPQLMLHESASASTQAERDPEIVRELLQQYPMSSGDVLVVASNSGRNACPVELSMAAKGRSV